MREKSDTKKGGAWGRQKPKKVNREKNNQIIRKVWFLPAPTLPQNRLYINLLKGLDILFVVEW